jgi:hypothetical protein
MFKKENDIFEWLIKMFIHVEDKFEKNKYKLVEEKVSEISFEIDFIEKILEKHNFKTIQKEDYHK